MGLWQRTLGELLRQFTCVPGADPTVDDMVGHRVFTRLWDLCCSDFHLSPGGKWYIVVLTYTHHVRQVSFGLTLALFWVWAFLWVVASFYWWRRTQESLH